jgi:hypothetical protein
MHQSMRRKRESRQTANRDDRDHASIGGKETMTREAQFRPQISISWICDCNPGIDRSMQLTNPVSAITDELWRIFPFDFLLRKSFFDAMTLPFIPLMSMYQFFSFRRYLPCSSRTHSTFPTLSKRSNYGIITETSRSGLLRVRSSDTKVHAPATSDEIVAN